MKRFYLALCLMLLIACTSVAQKGEETSWNNDLETVVQAIKSEGKCPDNYLLVKEAQNLGWIARDGNLHEVAPYHSIGNDRFYNREGHLPNKQGRRYYECDIDYTGGYRNAKRVVYSDDGWIFYTEDHYDSFEMIQEGEQ